MLSSGCASSGFPDVIEAREVYAAMGGPRIKRVRDAGNARVPAAGAWAGESDGVFVPGEVVVVEGDNFGKQPTLSIGGRATQVLARTERGGIVARVPNGVRAGDVEVVVSQPKGRATHPLKLTRLAVVVHDGKVWVLDVSPGGLKVHGHPLDVPGARAVRLSADGSAAWVLGTEGGVDRLVTIDLTAPGGARVANAQALKHKASLLASAQDAEVVAAVGEGKVTLFVAQHPLWPAPHEPQELPAEVRAARTIALSPDGKVLALLISDGNKLSLVDVEAQRAVLRLVTTVDLLPTERFPLVRDLAFAADGETLWVVSGWTPESPVPQPTRLTAVRLLFGETPAAETASASPEAQAVPAGAQRGRLLSVWRTQSVPGAAAPLSLTIARGQPVASGTTIRMPPEKAAVFVTSVNDALFKLADLDVGTPAGAKAAVKLWKPPQPGMMVRADIFGGGGPLFTTPQILGAVDLTPDAQLVLGTSARVTPSASGDGVALDFGVTFSPIWGNPAPVFLPLGPLAPRDLKPPFKIGDLRIQP